jgi:hypothetical protein
VAPVDLVRVDLDLAVPVDRVDLGWSVDRVVILVLAVRVDPGWSVDRVVILVLAVRVDLGWSVDRVVMLVLEVRVDLDLEDLRLHLTQA